MGLLRFEDLDVFKRAYAVSLDVHRASLKFPQVEQYGLGEQIRRSSKSICANIAEGMAKAKGSQAELAALPANGIRLFR
jgi:four helix bundle protein